MSETIEIKSKISKNKNTKSKPEILKPFNLMIYSSPKKYFKPPVNTRKKPMTPTKFFHLTEIITNVTIT